MSRTSSRRSEPSVSTLQRPSSLVNMTRSPSGEKSRTAAPSPFAGASVVTDPLATSTTRSSIFERSTGLDVIPPARDEREPIARRGPHRRGERPTIG